MNGTRAVGLELDSKEVCACLSHGIRVDSKNQCEVEGQVAEEMGSQDCLGS